MERGEQAPAAAPQDRDHRLNPRARSTTCAPAGLGPELRQHLLALVPLAALAAWVFSGCMPPPEQCQQDSECNVDEYCDTDENICVDQQPETKAFASNPDPIIFGLPTGTQPTRNTAPQIIFDILFEAEELQAQGVSIVLPGGTGGFQLVPIDASSGQVGVFEYFGGALVEFPVIADGTDQAFVDVDGGGTRGADEPSVVIQRGATEFVFEIVVPLGGDGSPARKLNAVPGGVRFVIDAGLLTMPDEIGPHEIRAFATSVDPGSGDADDSVPPDPKTAEVPLTIYVTNDGPNLICGDPASLPAEAVTWGVYNAEIGHYDGPYALPGRDNPDGLLVVDPVTLIRADTGARLNGNWAQPDDCHDIHLHTNGYDPVLFLHIDPAPCIGCDLYNQSACGHGCLVFDFAGPTCNEQGNCSDGDPCVADNECDSGYCDPDLSTCQPPPSCKDVGTCPIGEPCTANEQCESGYCAYPNSPFTCQPPPCTSTDTCDVGDQCETDQNCVGDLLCDPIGFYCREAFCWETGTCPNGDGCGDDSECLSGYCSDIGICDDPPPAECGNGQLEDGEACDDGNAADGDGCSSTCDEEPGFTCTGEPSVCTADPVCGNGQLEGGEFCDDGNTANGDGCSSSCMVEAGFLCNGEPSICVPDAVCGNGLLEDGEFCDDGNTAAGDGCSSICEVESGFSCTGEPSVCTADPVCGNGLLEDGEFCDDGNAADGDGCSSSCMVEGGFLCTGEPSVCVADAVCGNGQLEDGEFCDDGNTADGDGCSSICEVESGFSCTGEPSICTADPVCGNGLLEDGEFCDDGNGADGDGCSSICDVESGYSCTGEPSVCTADPVCGNGQLEDGEFCDDGNTANGDGCSSSCMVESGFLCTGEPSICVADAVCGNGLLEDGESCDDGNAADGDGCSSICEVESGFSCTGEPSICTADAACGDGAIDDGESCDDGNADNGDGCSSICEVESGFSCTGEPSVCTADPVCGNGQLEDGEFCDDGNAADGDGCSSACAIESGYFCTGEPSICIVQPAACGDGVVDDGEFCDDGNLAGGDGCSAVCAVEDDFVCGGSPSQCVLDRPPLNFLYPIDIRLGIRDDDSVELYDHKGQLKGQVGVGPDDTVASAEKLLVRYATVARLLEIFDWSDNQRAQKPVSDRVVKVAAAKDQAIVTEADGFPATEFTTFRYSRTGQAYPGEIVTDAVPEFAENRHFLFVRSHDELRSYPLNSNTPSGPPVAVGEDAEIVTTEGAVAVRDGTTIQVYGKDMAPAGDPIETDAPAEMVATKHRFFLCWSLANSDGTCRFYDENGAAAGPEIQTGPDPDIAATRDHVLVSDDGKFHLYWFTDEEFMRETVVDAPYEPDYVTATDHRFVTAYWDSGAERWYFDFWTPEGAHAGQAAGAGGGDGAGNGDGPGADGGGAGGGPGGGGGGGGGTTFTPVPGVIKLAGVAPESGLIPGALLSLNQATAAGTQLGDDVDPGGITGLGYTTTGLYATIRLAGGGASTLVKMNPGTGQVEAQVPIVDGAGLGVSIADLAVQPSTGVLFGIRSGDDGHDLAGHLYTIDTTSGLATLVGDTGELVGGSLGFAQDGTLYQATHRPGLLFGSVLNRLDPATGTVLGSALLDRAYDGLVVRPNDGLLCASARGTDEIWMIDPTSGQESYVGRSLTPEGANVAAVLGDLEYVPLP